MSVLIILIIVKLQQQLFTTPEKKNAKKIKPLGLIHDTFIKKHDLLYKKNSKEIDIAEVIL